MKNSNFNNLTTTKKGNIGELISSKLFNDSTQFVLYPVDHNTSHPVDFVLFVRKSKRYFGVEIKCKSKRKYFYDTGVDYSDFVAYRDSDIPIFLIFVDEEMGKIYGNSIDELKKNVKINHLEYPKRDGKYMYFPMESMKMLGVIDDSLARALEELTTKNDKYR